MHERIVISDAELPVWQRFRLIDALQHPLEGQDMVLIQLCHSFVLWFFPRVWVRRPNWLSQRMWRTSPRSSVSNRESSRIRRLYSANPNSFDVRFSDEA